MKIQYEGQELSENVVILKTIIENNTKKDIDNSIVHSPFKITFKEPVKLLRVELLNSPDNKIVINSLDNSVECKWALLKKREFLVLKILLKVEELAKSSISSDDILKNYTSIDYRITDIGKAKKINYKKNISQKLPKNELIIYPILTLFYFLVMTFTLTHNFYDVKYKSPLMDTPYVIRGGKTNQTIKIIGEDEKRIVTLDDVNEVQKETEVILIKEKLNIGLIVFIVVIGVITFLPTILSLDEYLIDKRVHSFFYPKKES